MCGIDVPYGGIRRAGHTSFRESLRGEKIYFNGTSLMLDCGLARDNDFELIQPLIDGNRPKDMREFNYKELCLVIENMYGYPKDRFGI
ncbi:MAG: hypothetical protein IKQ49_12375 [Eubacterium sp.]|nr:hypothetical protein [Eubacterium sp.]